jgi:hypothetical protein
MRQITKQAVKAFFSGKNFKLDNTEVTVSEGGSNVYMYLHGNLIAERYMHDVILHDAGWKTVTTKERLNGILDHCNAPKIYQSKGVWYQGSELWLSGSKIERV